MEGEILSLSGGVWGRMKCCLSGLVEYVCVRPNDLDGEREGKASDEGMEWKERKTRETKRLNNLI